MAPATMKAIKVVEPKKAEIKEVDLPKMRDDYILCKVNSVALNPADWKHIDFIASPGVTIGCDFSGVVEEVGPKVTKGWKKGDRIASFSNGANETQHDDGCFAEYCLTKGDLGIKIPDSMSDDSAATLGAGIVTCGQALYQSLGLPLPGEGNYGGYVLVYGGSTASGSLAIQYAVQSGCKVISTASKHNHELLKSLGAEEVFDYRDPECGKKIREYTKDQLTLALDCIAESGSIEICDEAISSKGGVVSYLLPTATTTRSDVEGKITLGYTVVGEELEKMGNKWPAKPEDFEHGKKFFNISQTLIDSGKLKPHPTQVGKDGLVGVFDGMQQLREFKASGVKLVYRIGETP